MRKFIITACVILLNIGAALHGQVIDVDESGYNHITSTEKRMVIVDFYADWCGPCKMLSPVLEEIATERAKEVRVIKVDVDRNKELARSMGVQGIPHVVFFKDGKQVSSFSGFRPKQAIEAQIASGGGAAALFEEGFNKGLEKSLAPYKGNWKVLLVIGILVQGLAVVVIWLLSKVFAEDKGTFLNALRYTLIGWLATVIFFAALFFAASFNSLVAIGLICIAGLIAMFWVPMHVYDIGFFRALVFLIVAGIACGIIQAITTPLALPLVQSALGVPSQEQEGDNETEASDSKEAKTAVAPTNPPKQPPVTMNELQKMYSWLQEKRKKLDKNNPQQLAEFNKDVAEYEALKKKFHSLQNQATPSPTPVKTIPTAKTVR